MFLALSLAIHCIRPNGSSTVSGINSSHSLYKTIYTIYSVSDINFQQIWTRGPTRHTLLRLSFGAGHVPLGFFQPSLHTVGNLAPMVPTCPFAQKGWVEVSTISRFYCRLIIFVHLTCFYLPVPKQNERKGKERKGKERKGKKRKGKERKGKERKGKDYKVFTFKAFHILYKAWSYYRLIYSGQIKVQPISWTSLLLVIDIERLIDNYNNIDYYLFFVYYTRSLCLPRQIHSYVLFQKDWKIAKHCNGFVSHCKKGLTDMRCFLSEIINPF